MRRTLRWLIYNGTTGSASLVGEWTDAPDDIEISVSGRYGALTVTLPRELGAADEPNEPDGFATVVEGYRVEIWCADEYTMSGEVTSSEGATLIWSGTIEDWAFNDDGLEVFLEGWHRLLKETPVPDPSVTPLEYYTAGPNFPPDLAKSLVDTYCGTVVATSSITWDPANPIGVSGSTARGTGTPVTSINFALTQGDVEQGLDNLLAAQGKEWYWYVSPSRLVRFFKADTATVNHRVTYGKEVTSASLRKSNRGRAKRVAVYYGQGGGGVIVKTSGSYTAADPRVARFSYPDLDATTADQIATEKLADLDRLRLVGSVTISADKYPIDTIQLGHTIRLHYPRRPGTGTNDTGYNDHNDVTLVVAAFDWSLKEITVHLTVPYRNLVDIIRDATKAIERNAGRAYPFIYRTERPPTTTTAPAAGGAGAIPGPPVGWKTERINGTARSSPYW